MSINLTDEIDVKTKKGKLGAAKQIFLEGDTQTVEKEIQDINSRHNDLSSKHESLSSTVSEHTNQIESNQSQITANKSAQDEKNATLDANMVKLNTRDDQITETLNNISATGGASVASAVTYNNATSNLVSVNVQGAIDEVSSIAHFAKRGAIVNISTNYNSDHIVEVLTLSQALSKVPGTDRVLGFQGKYLASDGWHTIIYIGDSLTDWGDTTKWADLADKVFNSISKNATFAGIAIPTTNPGTPDGPVFYIATTSGSYSNFNNIEVSKGESAILKWNNDTWGKSSFKSMTDFNSVFDDNGNSLTHKLNTLYSNISELEQKTKDLYTLEEDSFIITDKNGNKIAFFDKDGLHVTSIEVLKGDSIINILNVIADKVDKVDGKQLSTEDFTTELKEKLENLNDKDLNDKDILDDYDGLCIVDSNGYKALEIDANGDIKMNGNTNGALSGKSLYTLCDSLGTAGHWQKKLCDITGMVFDNNINVDKAHPLSAGGTKTSVSGMGTFTRAKNLVEYWKGSQRKTIDVLIIENINDMNDAGGHGDINDSAWFLTQQIVLDAVQSNSGTAESYFNNNVSSIVDSVTKKFGTTIRVPYSSGTAYRLQVTSKASQNGNITITIGSDVFIVGVNTEDSLADIAFKIAEYDFTNAGYNVYQDSETSVVLTRTSSTQSVVVNTNSTGVVVSNNTTAGVAYLDYCYIGSSLDSTEWAKLSNWMEQVTWSPISVVSLWARYKGLFDYLCKNLPDTKIYFMIAPRMSESIANSYKKTDGTYDVKAWMDANNSSTLAVREIQKQVAKMYNIPVLDMWEEANFTLANARYNYAGGSGVHPGINGYNRIGEAVARLINY